MRTAVVKPSFQVAQWDKTPIYRVIEVTRDVNGRLRKEGRVWHTDLDRMRKFGRAVAANSASHKVLIADAAGDVLEELPVATAESRGPCWSSWQDITLPPRPAVKARRKPPRPPTVPSGTNPFDSLDMEALSNALSEAAERKPAPPADGETSAINGEGAPEAAPAAGEPAGDEADDVEVLLP